jgi:hypothetical protein
VDRLPGDAAVAGGGVALVEPRSEASGSQLIVLVGHQARDWSQILPLVDDGTVVMLSNDLAGARTWLDRLHQRNSPRALLEPAVGLCIDMAAHHATWRGDPLPLSERELLLLALLANPVGHARSFDELLRAGWGTSMYGDADLVRCAVKRLRKKLLKCAPAVVVQSVPRFGFRLCDGAQ